LLGRQGGDGSAYHLRRLGGDQRIRRRRGGHVGAIQRQRARRPNAERFSTLVQSNGVQPGLERTGVLVAMPLAPHGQEDLLEEFLAAVAVACHPGQKRQQGAGVASQQALQQFRLPCWTRAIRNSSRSSSCSMLGPRRLFFDMRGGWKTLKKKSWPPRAAPPYCMS
jgi:hypothetical protein